MIKRICTLIFTGVLGLNLLFNDNTFNSVALTDIYQTSEDAVIVPVTPEFSTDHPTDIFDKFYSITDDVETIIITDDGFTFDTTTDTITSYNPLTGGTDIVIPEIIAGTTVEHIGTSAFSSKGLTSVILPNTITSIAYSAFSDNNLTSIDLPNTLTVIESAVFNRNNFTAVTIPNSITAIGPGAFANNQLTTVTLSNSITTIGMSAFNGNQLTSIVIPDSVTSLEDGAFANNQLTSINLPDSMTTISPGAFANNQLTSITIPNSITSISPDAFINNALTTVEIPSSVTSIADSAFRDNPIGTYTVAQYEDESPLAANAPWGATAESTVVWLEKHSVTFNAENATANIITKVKPNEKVAKPSAPIKPGFVFNGWYRADGTPWNFDLDVVTEDITLTAKWDYEIIVTNQIPQIAIDRNYKTTLLVGEHFDVLLEGSQHKILKMVILPQRYKCLKIL